MDAIETIKHPRRATMSIQGLNNINNNNPASSFNIVANPTPIKPMLTLIDTIAAMDISGASYGSQGATSATSTTKTVFLAAIKAMQTNLANMVANVEGALKSTQLILEQRPHILRCLRLSAIRDHPILNVTILERINDYKNVLKHIAKDVEKERAKIEAAPVVVPEHKQTIQGLLDQFMEESLTLEQFFVEYNERAGAPSN